MKFTCEICQKSVDVAHVSTHAEKHMTATRGAKELMDALSDEERLKVMQSYYSCCGTKHTCTDGGYCPKCNR